MAQPGYYDAAECSLEEFQEITGRGTPAEACPQAKTISHDIPIYDAPALAPHWDSPAARRKIMAEWAWVLGQGPGVLVVRQAQQDHEAIDRATQAFLDIIAQEKAEHGGGADHFAAAGANDRIWNTLQKLCVADPETFVRYHAMPAVDAACEAWLGPGYQMTAQVNLVYPGGAAQRAHRDYHLGFQTAEVSAAYPAHVHDLSPLMTLQGGLAHGPVPAASGPTKLLPFSQLYRPGYAAWRRDDFREHFEANCVQLPLEKGDALFFNPALFHAAGENKTPDIHRLVNLFQISSPFGRAMESIDRQAMCRLVFEPLKSLDLSPQARQAAIAATAEGYAFPTNLDTDPPTGGLAPPSQAALLTELVEAGADLATLTERLQAQSDRRRP